MNDQPETEVEDTAPHRQPGALSAAMKAADREIIADAGAAAIAQAMPQPVFMDYSHATDMVYAAQAIQMQQTVEHIDAQIAELNQRKQDAVDALDSIERARRDIAERRARRRR